MMLTLFRDLFHALAYDEAAARRWLAGLGGAIASFLTSLMVYGADQWRQHVVVSAVGAILTMLPTPSAKAP